MIKRYDIERNAGAGYTDVELTPEGEFCSWSDVEPLILERNGLVAFADARRVQINELLDALKSIADIVPEYASEAWMVQTAKDALEGKE